MPSFSEILAGLNVVVAAIYSVLTYLIVKSSKEQAELVHRPYITFTLRHSNQGLVTLVVKNTGKTNANNLKLSIDKKIFQLDHRMDEYDISKLYLLTNVIPTFPPETEFAFRLISSIAVQSDNPKDAIKEPLFTLTAEYSYSNKTVVEYTTIDLRTYRGIWMPDATIEDRIEELKDELKSIKDVLEKRLAP